MAKSRTGLKVLVVAAEASPLAKVGGLADVAGALPRALRAAGHDARIVMPYYRVVDSASHAPISPAVSWRSFPIHWQYNESGYLKQTELDDGTPVYLVGSDSYFNTATTSGRVYENWPDPYIFFCRAILELIPALDPAWKPDVVHLNDWHTALVAPLLHAWYRDTPAWERVAVVTTVHDLNVQGEFNKHYLWRAGLPDWMFSADHMEAYGRVNYLKGGLVFSHMANTVSPTYAREVQTAAFGYGLDGVMRRLAAEHRFSGIVNGIDTAEYNPECDTALAAHFSAAAPQNKAACKVRLQELLGLPRVDDRPVLACISRLTPQKGLDLILQLADGIVDLPAQVVVLGTGNAGLEHGFRQWQNRCEDSVRSLNYFDAALARQIYAGADMLLMPSYTEPCGLAQLIAMRYGCIPIVHTTGGLADTVEDVTTPDTGTGFQFSPPSADALYEAIVRACTAYKNKTQWSSTIQRAMQRDHGFTESAGQYAQLYKKAVRAAASQ